MRTYIITQFVCVKLDESKFTPEFLREYCENFCDLPTIEDHRRHLAKMFAQGLIEGRDNEFVEGYGVLSEMGIELTYDGDAEIDSDVWEDDTTPIV